MTSLGERPCWVPPPRADSNDQFDFLQVIVWLLEQGALTAGDYLIMDNARVHHGGEAAPIVKRLLAAAGVQLIYLPAYSPELNPCELVFGYVKGGMNVSRGLEQMWEEALRRFAAVTPAQMDSLYKHCIMGALE